MSSSDRRRSLTAFEDSREKWRRVIRSISRRNMRAGTACVAMMALFLSACQVAPLYGERATSPLTGGPATSIAVEEVNDRVSQEVRNELIFLLNGGVGQPPSPRYRLELFVARNLAGILRDPLDGEPTAQNLTLTAQYRLVENATDRDVAVRSQQVTATYDTSNQAFAALRALRDAENRAARELAERIRADLAILLNQGL